MNADDDLLLGCGILEHRLWVALVFAIAGLMRGQEHEISRDQDVLEARYMTTGTSIPSTPSALISSRRTIAAVVSRNFFRSSSASLSMG